MASLAEAIKAASNGGYTPVAPGDSFNGVLPPATPFRPRMRCPIPPVPMTPDTMRQADLGGQVPQRRTLTPTQPSASGSGTSTVSTTTVVIGSSSGSTAATLTAQVLAITAPTLTQNVPYITTVDMAKSFQLLYLTSDISVRVQLYGTQLAQFADIVRAINSTPSVGQNRNIITDVALDVSPYQWSWQNRIGANNDDPQATTLYLTITALSTSGVDANLSLTYLPLES